MRHSNTGKSDPQPTPAKRGFFAAAGERLKRAMSGSRAETATAGASAGASAGATATAASLPAPAPDSGEVLESEVTTSVQAKARELLQQDRAHKRGRSNAVVESDDVAELAARARKTSPPPLPWQRTAADVHDPQNASGVRVNPEAAQAEAITGTQPVVAPKPRTASKRPVRDSKSEALRARLGAAKAALAEAQAKRAAETDGEAASPRSDHTEPEIILEFLDELPAEVADSAQQPSASEATQREISVQAAAHSSVAPPSAADVETTGDDAPSGHGHGHVPPAPAAKSGSVEPIRTLTIARVLARQGYYDRSLSIYDALLAEAPDDVELRAEADRVRTEK